MVEINNNPYTLAPDWIMDLILYEVATKGFTSPNGPESGTFESLQEKLPYIHELGVTGIWLTGHSLSDPKHFYNIWTQYACILPDEIDPSLGDKHAFKHLIDTAHDYNIKVFLDVITHGVMNESPLTKQHPDWFKGGSWGMTDFDWQANHPELDNWWVNMWVHYVKEFGIDGFRLDVATHRPDLWSRIRQEAAALGHHIVVLAELGPSYTGAVDFIQWGQRISENHGFAHDHGLLKDVAGYVKQAVQPAPLANFQVELQYLDGTVLCTETPYEQTIRVTKVSEKTRHETGPGQQGPYALKEIHLSVTNVPDKEGLDNITVKHSSNFWPWQLKDNVAADCHVKIEGTAPTLELFLPALYPEDGSWLSTQLSCHDNGWDGFPLDQNPYAAHGSRFVFGYAALLAPGIPIFMAGEEFNADYVPLPMHTPGLFGEGEPGTGRWLYASWLQWEQLNNPEKQAMLEDSKHIIHIRRTHSDLIRPLPVGKPSQHLYPVKYRSEAVLPVPYLYQGEAKIILIAGNPSAEQDVDIRFELPEQLGFDTEQLLNVHDVWNDKSETMTVKDFKERAFTIKRDKTARGGLLILTISTS